MNEDYPVACQPLVLRFHRLIEAFSKSDDERDFYIDKVEGFILFLNLDKHQDELEAIEEEIRHHSSRYVLVPKLTNYETKKSMEGYVQEKVYDIDTKEKLNDIIGGEMARENFLEFIFDQPVELEKWQQYYNERSRIRIIEWLRNHEFKFVFEEDVDLPTVTMEKLKTSLFEPKVPRDVQSARNTLEAKSRTYYSSEALNPKPKRGRPPKQAQKSVERPSLVPDLYSTVPRCARHFLFTPDYNPHALTFSTKFETEEQFLSSLKGETQVKLDVRLQALSQRMESLRHLSSRLKGKDRAALSKAEELSKEALNVAHEFEKEEGNTRLSGLAKEILPSSSRGGDRQEKKRRKRVTPIKKGTASK